MFIKIGNFYVNIDAVNIIKFTKGEKFGRLKFVNNFKVMSFQVKKEKIAVVEELLKKLNVVDITDCVEGEEENSV